MYASAVISLLHVR